MGATKAGGAWTITGFAWWLESIGINTWGDAAAMLAAMYSTLLIIEWFWKRFKRDKGKRDDSSDGK
jgi:hypothetical protein